jgi:hypothetical protein
MSNQNERLHDALEKARSKNNGHKTVGYENPAFVGEPDSPERLAYYENLERERQAEDEAARKARRERLDKMSPAELAQHLRDWN